MKSSVRCNRSLAKLHKFRKRSAVLRAKSKILVPSIGVMMLVLVLVIVYTSVSVGNLTDELAESSSEQSKVIGSVLKKIKESMDKITRSTDNVLNKFEAIDQGVKTVAEKEETSDCARIFGQTQFYDFRSKSTCHFPLVYAIILLGAG